MPGDPDHPAVRDWISHNTQPRTTTDYIVDETLTLLRVRGERRRSSEMGNLLFSETIARLHYLTPGQITAGWDIFNRFGDKQGSFTDCTSFAFIQEMEIQRVLTLDHHFKQFGIAEVYPT